MVVESKSNFSTSKKVAIIDYGLCNLFSVIHACNHVGLDTVVTDDYDAIMTADAAILPGVGAFGEAMAHIHKKSLSVAISDFIASGKPFLGVCLGLHLLFDNSEEFGNHKGLGIIPGIVKKLPAHSGKVPQINWNTIEISESHKSCRLVMNLKDNEFMYFVHSFYVEPNDPNDILTYTTYGNFKYCSSIRRGNVMACQFHPEKSGEEGLKIYRNFKDMILLEE